MGAFLFGTVHCGLTGKYSDQLFLVRSGYRDLLGDKAKVRYFLCWDCDRLWSVQIGFGLVAGQYQKRLTKFSLLAANRESSLANPLD
jgi:hypothetical protein